MSITDITRLAIVDEINSRHFNWTGTFDEPTFLRRLYDLDNMESTDSRHPNAEGDIKQHRIFNNDWEYDWVFFDPRFELMIGDDDTFLRFLAETLHPALRRSNDEVTTIVTMYNNHLKHDGYELVEISEISGRPVFVGRSRLNVPGTLRQVEHIIHADSKDYLVKQISRMETNIESDPELAIGTAKEMVETCCKTILIALNVEPHRDWDLPKLVKETSKLLQLTPDDVKPEAAAAESIRRILGNLGNIVSGIAELRNSYGTGHGKALGKGGLGPRHARLAVGAASTLAMFLFETYEQRTP